MTRITPLAATIFVVGALGLAAGASSGSGPGAQPDTAGAREEGWLLKSYGEIAGTIPTAKFRSEVSALRRIVDRRTPDDIARFRWWATGGPAYRWNEILLGEMQAAFVTLPLAARHLALFHAALDDAMAVASLHGGENDRGASLLLDAAFDAGRDTQAVRFAPSAHAAVAAAAADMLAYLFPARAEALAARAEEAMQLRLLAGMEFPMEVAAGRAIGRQIAERAIARGKADRSDAKWSGQVPEGQGLWKGTNPIAPLAGTWQTWVLRDAGEFRPEAPPPVGSEQVKAALAELKTFPRSPKTNHRAVYWEVHGGARAHTLWNEIARTKLIENGASARTTARVLAALNVALADAGVACWDAKYAFWYIRPPQLDADLKTLFPPPNHPSFPAAHGCYSTAAATLLAGVFPGEREQLLALGKEAAEARVWAGIHYRFDIEAGQEIGRKVAERTLERVFATQTN